MFQLFQVIRTNATNKYGYKFHEIHPSIELRIIMCRACSPCRTPFTFQHNSETHIMCSSCAGQIQDDSSTCSVNEFPFVYSGQRTDTTQTTLASSTCCSENCRPISLYAMTIVDVPFSRVMLLLRHMGLLFLNAPLPKHLDASGVLPLVTRNQPTANPPLVATKGSSRRGKASAASPRLSSQCGASRARDARGSVLG